MKKLSAVFLCLALFSVLLVEAKKALDETGIFRKPIVTPILPAPTFFAAGKYYQN